MLTGLTVKNFKSVGSKAVSLKLKPLTILIGPNGSGKSNILESLMLFSQSVGQRLVFKGPLISYSDTANTRHKRESGRWMTFGISIRLEKREMLRLKHLIKQISKQLELRIGSKGNFEYLYSFKPKTGETSQRILSGKKVIVGATKRRTDGGWQTKFDYPQFLSKTGATPAEDLTGFLLTSAFDQAGKIVAEAPVFANFAKEIMRIFSSRLAGKVFPILAGRGTIPPQDSTRGPPSWVGVHGQDIIPILSIIFSEREEHRRYGRVAEKIVKWAREFGVESLSAGWSGERILRSDYVDPELETLVNLSMAGYGSKQIIPVITQLFWGKKGSILLIEEPETSLHPDGQVKLPELFAAAIRENKQVIVTTHSEFLILSLRRAIQKGLLTRNQISVYHVRKSSKGTEVKELRVGKRGYIKGWVPSFAEVEEKLLKEWFDTLPEED